MVPLISCGVRVSQAWKHLKLWELFFRQWWTEENNSVPKGIVGDRAFFTGQLGG